MVPVILEHGTPKISVEIEGMSRSLIEDTCSNMTGTVTFVAAFSGTLR
jgi:hypothetical protein